MRVIPDPRPPAALPETTRRLIFASVSLGIVLLGCKTISSIPETALATASPPRPTDTPARQSTTAILNRLGAEPCPGSNFMCVTLTVPLNHRDPADTRTIDVVFAVLPATGERKGMFVTVVGGPGGSGLAVADSYSSAFDPTLLESFDAVFLDPRGLAASGGLQCRASTAAYYQSGGDPATADGEAILAEAAQQFAKDCTTEMGHAERLPFLGTEQAIEDLEAFRRAMQDDRFWLYGESYGTQFAQFYAAAHPEHLAGLILDGPIDLQPSGLEFVAEQARAFEDVLGMTLDACAHSASCSDDMGTDPATAFDELASRLSRGAVSFDFPLPSGSMDKRQFTLAGLRTAAATYIYSEGTRTMFLRALAAAASRGDFVPLARILYDSLALDPETLEPVLDPSWSDAIYYAVECNDYDFGPAEDYLRAGDAVDASLPRLGSIFYGDLPCAFWPEDGYDPGRPAALEARGIPTLVLVGTADPATPVGNARRIASHLEDGYLVVEDGGPHVVFGWGNGCVDNLVTAFLVEDQRPDRETTCPGILIQPYVPLSPEDASTFVSPLEALTSVDTEIYFLPEYAFWDLVSPTQVGCPFGGALRFESSETGEALSLGDCAFADGFAMTGHGGYDYDQGEFRLDVSIAGPREGDLVYTRDANGRTRVQGEFDGEPVDLSP
jgi:pimeloyl-ACP methyl ester carboxylesterase